MAAKKKKTATANPVATAIAAFDPNDATLSTDTGSIYVGVQPGSDLEKQLVARTKARTGPAKIQTQYPQARPWGQVQTPELAYKNGSDQEPGQWDPNDLVTLQMRLHMAGMLDNFIPGSFDKSTRSAYRDLLSMANTSSMSWQDTLDQVTANGGVTDDSNAPPPLTVELTNPADLESIAKKVAQTTYGGDPPADFLARFTSAFNAAERDAQTADYNAKYGTGGEVVAPPNAQVMAEAQLKAEQPNQVAATQFGARMDDIIGTLTTNRAGAQ